MRDSKGFVSRSLLVVIGILFLCLGKNVKTVWADNTEYPIWIGDVRVTDENRNDVLGDGTVSYVPAVDGGSAKLILNGLQLKTYSEKTIGNTSDIAICGIYCEQSLEVVVLNSNVITVIHRRLDVQRCYGIYQKGTDQYLRFSGDGSLIVASDLATARSFGIRAENIIVTEQVRMNVAGGNIMEDPGSTTSSSYGLYAKGRIRVINEARVVTVAGNAEKAFGVYVEDDVLQVKDSAVLEASGKKAISLRNNNMLQMEETAKKFIQINQPKGDEEPEYWNGDRLEDHAFLLLDAGKGTKEGAKENAKQSNLVKFIMLIGFAILVLIASTVVISVAMITKHKR